jgi:hypothetical protein
MGNYNTRSIKFIQSPFDFPCPVNLGKNTPSFGLYRFNQALRFVPPDDEGFTMQGDKRRLVYKGRRRSHRFTILGDTAFEYDCILEKEPESNVVTLLMEGAEHFDFFQQPDFVPDPFMKGSYAVYKKETLLGEGTGKLCHIHRPLIIDARGRKVWGDLSVLGNELRITIPEGWLAEAKYPVVVDPTVGSEQLGGHELFSEFIDGWNRPVLIQDVGLNRYLLGQDLTGTCTFNVYAFWTSSQEIFEPCIYTDNNNSPHQKKSEFNFAANVRVDSIRPPGWRTSTFWINDKLNAGTHIWFGGKCGLFSTRFDYVSNPMVRYQFSASVPYAPSLLPAGNARLTLDIRFSWYFTYSTAQNHVRTLTQGVRLTDTRTLSRDFRRTTVQTVRGSTTLSRFETFYRRCIMNVSNSMTLSRHRVFLRSAIEQIKSSDAISNKQEINRKCDETAVVSSVNKKQQTFSRTLKDSENVTLTDSRKLTGEYKRSNLQTVRATTEIKPIISFLRKCIVSVSNSMSLVRVSALIRFLIDRTETSASVISSREVSRKFEDKLTVNDKATRSQGFYRGVKDNLTVTDRVSYPILFVRTISETQGITDKIQKWGDYIRGLYVEAGSIAETVRWGDYYRKESDVVQADGALFRHILIFIKLLSTSLVRDFIIRRILIAREELVLKSCVTREMVLESKIC